MLGLLMDVEKYRWLSLPDGAHICGASIRRWGSDDQEILSRVIERDF